MGSFNRALDTRSLWPFKRTSPFQETVLTMSPGRYWTLGRVLG